MGATLWRAHPLYGPDAVAIGFVFTFVNGGLSGCIW